MIPTDGYLVIKLTKVVESLVVDGYFFMYSMINSTLLTQTVPLSGLFFICIFRFSTKTGKNRVFLEKIANFSKKCDKWGYFLEN